MCTTTSAYFGIQQSGCGLILGAGFMRNSTVLSIFMKLCIFFIAASVSFLSNEITVARGNILHVPIRIVRTIFYPVTAMVSISGQTAVIGEL